MAGYNCTLYLCALLLIHVNICADANVHAHAGLCACIPSCNCDQLWATVHEQTHALVRMSSLYRKVSDHHDRQSAVITAWAHTTWETAVITACFTMIDHGDQNFYVCVHACVCTRAWTLVYTWTSKYKHGDHHAHTCAALCADMHHTACEPAVVTAGFTTIDHDDRKFHARVHVCVRLCVDTCLHMNKRVQAWRPACSPICSFASIHAHTACKTAVVNACFSMINHCDRTFHLHVHACVRLCVDTCWHMNKGLQACRPACTHICYCACVHVHTACEMAVVTTGPDCW